jgi:hypothetical protein
MPFVFFFFFLLPTPMERNGNSEGTIEGRLDT